jgi:hypothetical protein
MEGEGAGVMVMDGRWKIEDRGWKIDVVWRGAKGRSVEL